MGMPQFYNGVPLFGSGGTPAVDAECCCVATIDCDDCEPLPEEIIVDLSSFFSTGSDPRNCDECSDLNAVYLLPTTTPFGGEDCIWRIVETEVMTCSGSTVYNGKVFDVDVQLRYDAASSTLTLSIVVIDFPQSQYANYQTSVSSPCSGTYTSWSLLSSGGGIICDFDIAEISVTI